MTKGREPRKAWDKTGPYKVLRRLRSTDLGEVGRVYAAQRRANGSPALLVTPGGREPYQPSAEWQLRLRATTEPDPCLALEVVRAPAGAEPLAQIAEGLDVLTAALERLEDHPHAERHLSAQPLPRKRARWQWRNSHVAMLGAAAVVALLCWPKTRTEEPPVQAAEVTAASIGEEALSEPEALPVARMVTRADVVALDMPKKPFPDQWRVDGNGKCKGSREVPINGGCWVALEGRAPCGDDAYEWKGKCYWPAYPPETAPSTARPPPTLPVPADRAE